MIDLSQFEKRTSGEWKVRKIVDDSGDYITASYDVMAHYAWGDKCICSDLDNPYDAMLFAMGPELISEIEKLRLAVYDLTQIIDHINKTINPNMESARKD
jgi:hypothetical protein